MSKKKDKKEEKPKKPDYYLELNGLLLVVITIIGLVTDSFAGKVIKNFSIFLVGSAYGILLLLVLILGCYLIVNRKWPDFFTSNMVGFYILSLAFLTFLHLEFVKKLKGFDVIKGTIDNLMQIFAGYKLQSAGGGIIGGSFSLLLSSLFDVQGLLIIVITIVIVGVILLFNVSIYDLVKTIKNNYKKPFKFLNKKFTEEDNTKKESVVINNISEVEDTNPHEEENKIQVVPIQVEEINYEDEEVINTVGNDEVKIYINNAYSTPPLSILDPIKKSKNGETKESILKTSMLLEAVLKDFSIEGKVVEVHSGPTVSQYELELKSGTKVSKILSIYREIALNLAAKDVRIQAPIPGKSTVGVEIPNKNRSNVSFREIMEAVKKKSDVSKLTVGLGKNLMGQDETLDIAKTPHLLVAGSTGSGKSVCINTIICGILMNATPEEVKFILIDPKKVELSGYNGIPHLLAPVVTDPKKASIALRNVVSEMDRRYNVFSDTKTRNITSYNEYVESMGEDSPYKKLPYIVVVVDELADLMLVSAKEVEDSILRITQMARAAGIHLIIATQRPSTDVITGIIKANVPSRIAFTVASIIDSRTILNSGGAEKLIGKGDMLCLPIGENYPYRVQGAFLSDDEVRRIVDYTISQQKANYELDLTTQASEDFSPIDSNQKEDYDDPLYDEIVDFAIATGKISASLIQRKYRLGYNRAARVIDLLEERGIIGPQNGSKPRDVLIKKDN